MRSPRPRAGVGPSPLGPYLEEIDATPLLSAKQEQELALRLRAGDPEARDLLVRANLRLVVHIARTMPLRGLTLQDLIAEGNLGLIRAAEDYDPSLKTRFSTYAAYWIRHAMKRAIINTGRAIRIPAHMAQLLSEWRRASLRLHEELGRPATDTEIADHLRLSRRKRATVLQVLRLNAVSPGRLEDRELPQDHFVDERTPAPGSFLVQDEELRQALSLLDHLKPIEVTVLRLRFGLHGEEPRTLAQVGELLGLSRERARQIERDALERLASKMAGD
jgi:RNA polymerase primary sigma factor